MPTPSATARRSIACTVCADTSPGRSPTIHPSRPPPARGTAAGANAARLGHPALHLRHSWSPAARFCAETIIVCTLGRYAT
jgi:hypothetical protein